MERTITFNERKAIEEYIEYLKKDNDRITAMYREQREKNMLEYKEAIKRIRVLDEIDRQIEKPAVQAVEEEKTTVTAGIQPLSLQEAIEQYNKERELESKDKPFEYNSQAEQRRTQQYAETNRKNKRAKRIDTSVVAKDIASFLKERGVPTKANEITKHLRELGYKLNNPYLVLKRVKEYDPKVEMVTKGFYQYRR
jgi:hypothetical protein